jgi:hypothetical protein
METLTPSLLFVLYQIADVKTKTKQGFIWRLYTINQNCLGQERKKKRGEHALGGKVALQNCSLTTNGESVPIDIVLITFTRLFLRMSARTLRSFHGL